MRGMDPWPGAYTYIGKKMFKIWKAEVTKYDTDAAPGSIIKCDRELIIATGDGALKLLEVQLEGKKRMETEAFLRGVHLEPGNSLGNV